MNVLARIYLNDKVYTETLMKDDYGNYRIVLDGYGTTPKIIEPSKEYISKWEKFHDIVKEEMGNYINE